MSDFLGAQRQHDEYTVLSAPAQLVMGPVTFTVKRFKSSDAPIEIQLEITHLEKNSQGTDYEGMWNGKRVYGRHNVSVVGKRVTANMNVPHRS